MLFLCTTLLFFSFVTRREVHQLLAGGESLALGSVGDRDRVLWHVATDRIESCYFVVGTLHQCIWSSAQFKW